MFGDVPKTPEDLFQLTPSRRATHSPIPHQIHKYISTHALTEGDTEEGTTLNGDGNFNSRPHGGRPERYVLFFSLYEFQLTPSRRATSSSRGHCRSVGISTHALTEGDSLIGNNSYAGNISTHALTEGDEQRKTVHGQHIISTHALTEGDVVISVSCLLTWNFNSRPHGGRLHTPEDRGAEAVISTHALTEGDTAPARSPGASEHFNSRPHGGRPVHCPFSSGVLISTHALTEGDVTGKGQRYFVNISTHALTEGDICS